MRNLVSRHRGARALFVRGAAWAAMSAVGLGLALTTGAAAQQAPKSATKQTFAPPATHRSTLVAVISISRQRITIYDDQGVVAQSPISSGRKGFDSPEGVFSILERKEEHFSNVYEDAEMPFMQRLTWSGVALHAGNLPGYPASHGCIRLPHGFAERLFGMTRVNTRVVIVPNDTAPMSIAHPSLLQMTLPAVARAPHSTPTPSLAPGARPDNAGSSEMPMMLGARLAKPLPPETAETPLALQRAVTTPIESARVLRISASEKAIAATKAADSAKLIHKASLSDVVKLQRAAIAADAVERRAKGKAQYLERMITLAKSDVQIEKARAMQAAANVEAEAATKAATVTKATLATKQSQIAALAETAKVAEQAKAAALNEARAADRLTDPVSVLVSRKTGKLYIRQGRHPVTEIKVTIRDLHRPLGTHVFTAMSTSDGGRKVSWTVVTAQSPSEPAAAAPLQSTTRKGRSVAQVNERPVTPSAAALAAAALDRIEIPEEAIARIAPFVQAGSSLVISDLGPSIEMGPGTDFILQTRGEEQAIAETEKRAKEIAAAKAGEKWARDLLAERAERIQEAKERAIERAAERAAERNGRTRRTN